MDTIDKQSNDNGKEVKSVWMCNHLESRSSGTIYDSDEISLLLDRHSELLNIDFKDQESEESIEMYSKHRKIHGKTDKLQIVQLDSISISSTAAQAQHIVNLKQSFTFPAVLKPTKQISTQTSQFDLMKHYQQTANDQAATVFRHFATRPTSLPPENAALTNLKKRVQADVRPTLLGDGDKKISIEKDLTDESRLPDLEFGDFIAPSPVQCVMIQHKSTRQPTPKFNCKKVRRPQTKYAKKRFVTSKEVNSSTASECSKIEAEAATRGTAKEGAKSLSKKKPKNLFNKKTLTDASTESVFNTSFGHNDKLSAIVDKLQDQDWEICNAGLQSFVVLASTVDWESEMGLKFIPIVSRKFIDFFKSPRSNLCRTACQTAGEFFLLAKSTKRPEFDEMVDILLCKTSDPNRFIRRDANIALDKMAISICVHHSIRAVCSKGPDHKNPVVRASTARLLYHICKHAGVEQIVGTDANPRTRKRVLTNLAKFLIDQNQETRRHAEKLCKMLKHHKFFLEYFFKDIENNFKNPLRKIVNSLDLK